ncbi:hypothetical protein Hs30E_10450 [Lactococcus hodotermopsidis]|uniref:Uncharacterized protein n=1 Tax=Pseudolactococcus hodotermopsidis TaxID=2709157 RepID=A0A6A0BDE7_9LACT|nr:hypothetical protein [Lactococcus hodotermopsidis]GFH42494.1 hypothetical protein Hs30E_10450 [Lactococcus hodotermopsidis]
MNLVKCTSGTIVIGLGSEFLNITVKAVGERIKRGEGFCLSIASIVQEEPTSQRIEPNEQKRIATAISKWETAPFPIEFYEAL